MNAVPQPAEPIAPFDAWRRAHGLTYAELGKGYGVGEQIAYRHCRLPGSKMHRVPRERMRERVFRFTAGQITPNHFYDLPELWGVWAPKPVEAAA